MTDIQFLYDDNNASQSIENESVDNESIPNDIESIRQDVEDSVNPDSEEERINRKFLAKSSSEKNRLKDSYNEDHDGSMYYL